MIRYFVTAAAVAVALALSGALNTADARGGGWTEDTTNTNPGGNNPPGQQGKEKDSPGWESETTVTNPGGNQPPGQQNK